MSQPFYLLPAAEPAIFEPPRAPWRAARLAVAGLLAAAATGVLSAVAEVITFVRYVGSDIGDYAHADAVLLGVELVDAVVVVSAAVAFVAWSFLAHQTCERLGADPDWSRGWTIGAWCVPGGNLVLPWLVLTDLRDSSMPDQRGPTSVPRAPVGCWWVTFLLAGVTGTTAAFAQEVYRQPSRFIAHAAEAADDPVLISFLAVAEAGLTVAAAVLAVLVVLRTTRAQEQRAANPAYEASGVAVPS